MAESDAEHTPPPAISMNSEELLASRLAIKLLEIVPGDKIVEPPSIYRVLPYIRAEGNGAYDPKIISIGPFHRNNEELLPMQQLKWLFLHDLILTYLTRGEMDNLSARNDVSHLLQLFHFTLRPTIDGQDDKSDTATCFKCVMILTRKIKHVLLYSFYWCLSLILYCRRPPGRDACIRAPRMIPSATELQEAGVQFKAKKKARGFLDVTFEDGVLEMPMLPIQSSTIPLFRAFEQCTPESGSDFTSYVALMDNLIDTSDDVLVLERCGILESKLGGEEEVTKFFNSLRMGTYLEYDNHCLVDLFTEVKEYSADESHQWRAMLVHDYFGNPWSVVSLIAAIVLLVLTAVQTIFTVF